MSGKHQKFHMLIIMEKFDSCNLKFSQNIDLKSLLIVEASHYDSIFGNWFQCNKGKKNGHEKIY